MMKTILTIATTLLIGLTGVFAEEKGPKATPIDISKVKFGEPKGKANAPTVITSAEELKKAFSDEELLKKLEKTDFAKEKLLFFSWGGSGGDKLTAGEGKGEIVFTLQRGLTRDFVPHHYLFSLPKEAKFTVVAGK